MSRELVMDPRVSYSYDRRGEDFGWSESARQAGYTLEYDFRTQCKHVMRPEDLDKVDRRIGW